MTNKQALELAMAMVEESGLIAVNRAKASPAKHKMSDQTKDEAAEYAEAWNMLKHLSKIV